MHRLRQFEIRSTESSSAGIKRLFSLGTLFKSEDEKYIIIIKKRGRPSEKEPVIRNRNRIFSYLSATR